MIKVLDVKTEVIHFPVGEVHVRIKNSPPRPVDILFEYQNDQEIIELLMTCDALKRSRHTIHNLYIPYVPFSRQDRINEVGECFSLAVFCNLINSIDAENVIVTDPHSDVTPALLKNCTVIDQHHIFLETLVSRHRDYYLISPDGGALKKIYKLATLVKPIDVIECSKKRDTSTGAIKETHIPLNDFDGKDCYIVDDICDGGRTFIEIAKVLKQRNAGKVILMVTHGFFTKGLEVFDGLIDEIYTRKGKVK